MRLRPLSFRLFFLPVFALLLTTGCETPIDVEIPLAEPMLVVEGRIETGAPPIVLLSRSQNYFDPVDATLLGSLYEGGGEVRITVDGETILLDEVCAGDLGPTELKHKVRGPQHRVGLTRQPHCERRSEPPTESRHHCAGR